jgi:formylglycine-generating enzyme required for sulfatase activity
MGSARGLPSLYLVPLTVAASLLAIACGRRQTGGADTGAISTDAVRGPAPSAPPATNAPSPSLASSRALTDEDVAARVQAFFHELTEGSDFEFLRDWLASPVMQFITLKNADIDAVIRSSRGYFLDKLAVRYVPDIASLRIERRDGATIARMPVDMHWGTRPRDIPAENLGTYDPSRGDLDRLWNGLVAHDVTVDVELAFEPSGLLTRYVELAVRHPLLRVTGEDNCAMEGLRKGQTVVDLGDAYITGMTPKGPQQIHRVRVGGEDRWIDEIRSWAVYDSFGGHAGGSTCLEPALDATTSARREPSAAARRDGPAASTVASTAAVDDALRARVADFFAHFNDASDDEFLRASFAPRVDQFMGLKDAAVEAVVGNARTFFRDKHNVRYVPVLDAILREPGTEATVVRVPVAMSWETPLPAGWDAGSASPAAGADAAPGSAIVARVHHKVTADVLLAWSPAGVLTRFLEVRAHPRLMRVMDVDDCPMEGLARGQAVWDLGDTYERAASLGSLRLRRVQSASGDSWVGDVRLWSIANPSGRAVTGRSVCLALAPAPGKAVPKHLLPDDDARGAVTEKCPAGMARVPAGQYSMSDRGVSETAPDLGGDAVGVDAFCLDVTEVTVDAFAACVRAGRCAAAHLNDQSLGGYPPTYGKDARCNYGVEGKGNHPINCVALTDAVEFCRTQDKRLPTEEEWEWAARGGAEGRTHPWGSTMLVGQQPQARGDVPRGQLPRRRRARRRPRSRR